MSLEETIGGYVEEQFKAFQLSENDLGSEIAASSRLAATIEKHVHILLLNDGMNGIQLNVENQQISPKETDVHKYLVPLLTNYVDAAATMKTNSGNKVAVQRAFHLIAALTCNLSSKSDTVTGSVLERIKLFSIVESDRHRSQACQLMGCLASHLIAIMVRHEKKKKFSDEREGWSESLQMISTILFPRLTDKSQSVRQSAIQATGKLLKSKSKKELFNGSEILEGLLWSVWHDPSVANRVEAVKAVRIESAETLDHVIARLRDVKAKVRVAAIDAVRLNVDPRQRDIMTEEHFRDIIRYGLTDRCEDTKLATMKLICTKWTKAAKFCPVELLRLMGATSYEEECEKALEVVLDEARTKGSTKSNSVLQELSDPEIRSLCENIDSAMVKLTDPNVVFDEFQLFYTRIACSTLQKSTYLTFAQKEDLLSKTTPDIPTLCDLFQKHLDRFIESVEEDDEECMDQECFVCLQLLQLAKVAGVQEEGSRRYFGSVMVAVLAKSETPEDVIEDCVIGLKNSHQNDFEFFDAISTILANFTLNSDDMSDMTTEHMRVLLIFSIVLENSPATLANHDVFGVMTKIILSAVMNSNRTLRELGINCFGKLGLFSDPSTLKSDFKPILLKIAGNELEAIQCRGQALLGLSDWTLLFSDMLEPFYDFDTDEHLSVVHIIQEVMQHENQRLAAIAAEVATKLLFSAKVLDKSLLAPLLVAFMDPDCALVDIESSDEDIEVKEVGSPARLQQLLSLFFPAFCLKSEDNRVALIDTIEMALEIALDRPKLRKRKKRSSAFPLIRIVEYVYALVFDENQHPGDEMKEKNPEGSNDDKLDVTLLMSLRVAGFLVKNGQRLNLTQLRALCKFLGNQDIEIRENNLELGKLKDSVEELTFLEDSTSLKALRPLTELLSTVEGYEDNVCSDSDGENESDDDESIDEKLLLEGTMNDEIMVDSISRLSLENKENDCIVEKSSRKGRRSGLQKAGALQPLA